MKFVLTAMQRAPNAGNHQVRQVGEFERLEDAVAAAKQLVDATLTGMYAKGITSLQLLDRYRESAATPIITRDDDVTMNANTFNHFQYAKTRSEEMCANTP